MLKSWGTFSGLFYKTQFFFSLFHWVWVKSSGFAFDIKQGCLMLLLDIKKTLMSCLNIRIGIDVLPDAISWYYLTLFNEKKFQVDHFKCLPLFAIFRTTLSSVWTFRKYRAAFSEKIMPRSMPSSMLDSRLGHDKWPAERILKQMIPFMPHAKKKNVHR